MNLKYITGFLLIGLILFSGCKKYEEGPGVSFLTKKSRVSNEWAFASAIESDVDVTEDYKGAVLNLANSGTANFSYFTVENGIRTLIEQDGEWQFAEKKEHINLILYSTTGSYLQGFKILELRRNSMHLKSDQLDKDWKLISNNLR